MIRKPLSVAVGALLAIAVSAPAAWAQTFTWNGAGGNGNWSTATNWQGGVAPTPEPNTTAIVLAGTNQLLTTLDLLPAGGLFDVNSLTFDATAGAFVVNPTAGNVTTLQIGTGGITSASGNLQTFAAPLALSASQTWAVNGAGGLTVTGAVNLNANTLTVGGTGSGAVTIGGVVSGAGGITKAGTNTLTLSGANTYTGPTIINGGVLATANLGNGGAASGIGASPNAAANLVLDGGTLRFTGGTPATPATTNRLFTLGAAGGTLEANGAGVLNFTNAGAAAFSGSGTRTLTLTGTTGTVTTLVPNGANQNSNVALTAAFNTFAPAIGDGTGGATNLVKSGTGTWVLAGANTYTGTTTVNAGTLAVNRATGGATPLGTGTVTLNGVTLSLRGAAANPLTLTGYNQDVISSFSDIATPNPFGTTAALDAAPVSPAPANNQFVLMENRSDFLTAFGLPDTIGLPPGGRFVSAANPLTTYQLAPYGANGVTSNNTLYLSADSTNTGSFNIAAGSQAPFQTVSLLVTGGAGATTFNAVLRFSDTTTTTINGLTAPDWFNNTPFAITNLGRMDRFDGDPQAGVTTNPRLYPLDLYLSTADQAKTLVGIDFTRTGGGRLNVFGLSGAAVGGATSYGNAVSVTASSTLEMLNTGSLAFGPLTIGTATLTSSTPGAATPTTLTFGGATLTGNPTFNIANLQTFTPGAIDFNSAARTVTKAGGGIMVLNAAATNATAINTLTSNAGTTNVTNATALGGTPNLTVGGGTANLGPVAGLNNLTVSGGTANLPSVTAINGTATITGGTTNVTPAVTIATATVSNGTLNLTGGATVTTATVNGGTVNLGPASNFGRLNGTGGTVAIGANTLTVGGGNQADSFGGAITGTNGVVTKVGTGTQTLTSIGSSYSGGTNLTAGRITATLPGALGTGAVNLGNGTTLAVGGAPPPVTTISGFGGTGTGWTLNGGPTVAGDVLTLTTNANNQTRSAWFNTQQATGTFTARFDYTRGAGSGNPADGFTFTLHNQATNPLNALGGGGGSLGYSGITPSAAVQVNIFNNNGRGIAVRTNGVVAGAGNYAATTPVDFFNNPTTFTVSYNATIQALNITLTQGANVFNFPTQTVNLGTVIGANAYVGFTGATGGENATQQISNFTFGTGLAVGSTYANAVNLAGGAAATISPIVATGVTTFTMGNLGIGSGASLTVQPDTGSLANTAYNLTLGATTLAGPATFTVANNGTGTGQLTLGALADGGTGRTITKAGAGTLVLSGAAASLVNGTQVNVTGGTLQPTNATALGNLAAVNLAATTNLSLGAAQTLGSLSGTGNTALNGNALTVGSTNNLSSTYGGVISGAAGLTKAGTGTLTLTAANAYTGPTAVNAGALIVNGSLASTAAVTVAGGATLGGSGTLNGPTTLAAGATLSPGASVGTLTVNNAVTINGGTGSTWVVEINGNGSPFPPPAATPNDRLALTGAANNLNIVADTANKLTISLRGIDGWGPAPLGTPMSYTIATTDPGAAIQSNGAAFAYDPNAYTFEAVDFFAENYSLAVSGNQLVVTFTPIPEPGTVLAVSVAGLGLLAWGRRLRRRGRGVAGST